MVSSSFGSGGVSVNYESDTAVYRGHNDPKMEDYFSNSGSKGPKEKGREKEVVEVFAESVPAP